MNPKPSIVLLLSLIGCAAGHSPTPYAAVFCPVESTEPSIAPDVSSSLGFAASDVLDGLQTEFVLPVVATSDGTTLNRDFRFTFTSAGDPHVEERQPVADDGHQAAFCLSGPTLRIPVTVDVTVDGWFIGSGPGEVAAQGLDPESSWVSASVEVDPSEALDQDALARNPSSCDAESISLALAQVELPFTPWSEGPVGGISMFACGDRVVKSLYDWGEHLPPED